jgi:hypothetical protein
MHVKLGEEQKQTKVRTHQIYSKLTAGIAYKRSGEGTGAFKTVHMLLLIRKAMVI